MQPTGAESHVYRRLHGARVCQAKFHGAKVVGPDTEASGLLSLDPFKAYQMLSNLRKKKSQTNKTNKKRKEKEGSRFGYFRFAYD